MTRTCPLLGLVFALAAAGPAVAQPPGKGPPPYTSPEVKDGKVTFRLRAAKAEKVGLASSDIPGGGQGPRAMTKGEGGLWEITLDVAPGTYRYRIDVDGVPVVDPRNPAVSESFGNAWSLVRVPGAAFMDTADVPHGAVAAVTYRSKTVGRTRRAHVYTPPGYETGTDRYPVFYLLHGAGDSDDSWTSVGRAHDILDNLIAAKKAVPMIVVMPAGHDGKLAFGRPVAGAAPAARFEDDFETDLRPHVEKTYRVKTDRANRAIAGLSMGGLQTLNVFAARPADYSAVGVFSSGVFGNKEAQEAWAKQHTGTLSAAAAKDVKVLWFATGKDDFVLNSTKGTIELLKKLQLKPAYRETAGGHTWINWQKYLSEFAPLLFTD
jgi:enterochelin esterase family protein